mgnify:CR=1 FL=1
MDKLNKYDERECALACSVFTDEHFGMAITEEEFEYRRKLEEEYKQEIEEAKILISKDNNFTKLSYEEKIIFCIELIRKLRIKNKKDVYIESENLVKNNINYYEIKDSLNSSKSFNRSRCPMGYSYFLVALRAALDIQKVNDINPQTPQRG